MNKHISILGIRGLPAAHGGFEAFAEKLSLYLVEKGWKVTVYCQEFGEGSVCEKYWQGVRLIVIPVKQEGAMGSIIFDWKSILHAIKQDSVVLTLGYNTAVFNLMYRLKHKINIINMDGLEWKRAKWSFPIKAWFYLNEIIGCHVGNYLIADHPEIRNHLVTRVTKNKVTMIPYGADDVTTADEAILSEFNLEKDNYYLIIARPEPENSILEIVKAFSIKYRDAKLVVLGKFDERINYHKEILAAANDNVIFVGAIYDKKIVSAFRYFCLAYIHGHQVGGTNPSLVEALGAGSAVIAHDNKFNRWVAGSDACYFPSTEQCAQILNTLDNNKEKVAEMRLASKKQFYEKFQWDDILLEYEKLISIDVGMDGKLKKERA